MFYVKSELTNGKIVKTEITDQNTYCTCPICGRETHVDLEEFAEICGEGVELYGRSAIWCDECSEKLAEERRQAEQKERPNFLCAVHRETGETVGFDVATFMIDCPDCHEPHEIDLAEIVSSLGGNFTSFDDLRVYCEDCTAKRAAARNP
jgi:hypothetical protein